MNIVFVCKGNICRSPTAAAVFSEITGGSDRWSISSVGTEDWNAGLPADARAAGAAAAGGYRLDAHRARQIQADDLLEADAVVVVDEETRRRLTEVHPELIEGARVIPLLSGDGGEAIDIADPYGGSDTTYREALALIEAGCRTLEARLRE